MHEAFWNGLFDVRWEEAPLGAEAIRLTVRLREEQGSDQVRDDDVVTDFLGGHFPGREASRAR